MLHSVASMQCRALHQFVNWSLPFSHLNFTLVSTSTFEDEAQVDTDIEKTNHSLHKDDQREDEEVSSLEVSNEQ